MGRVLDDAILLTFAAGLVFAITSVLERRAWSSIPLTLGDLYGSGPLVEVGVPPMAPTILIGLLAIGITSYFVWASVDQGRSLGRRAVGLKVVRADGGDATWTVLLAREFVRFLLAATTLTVAWLGMKIFQLALEDRSRDVAYDLLHRAAPWATFLGALVGWIALTLVDPLGRAPHDRIAGTRVVANIADDGPIKKASEA